MSILRRWAIHRPGNRTVVAEVAVVDPPRLGECCVTMRQQLSTKCDVHGLDCPDIVVRRYRYSIGLPIKDDHGSFIELKYCPWCAAPLIK